MNKKFLFFIIFLSSTIFLQANQRRATCDNAQPPLTEEEHATCKRVEEFMIEATKLYSNKQRGWQERQRLGLTQWNLALEKTPLSATSAQHIEAVLYDAGFGTIWNPLHAWDKALTHVLWHEVYPAIVSYGTSAIITVTGVATGASLFMHKATVEHTDTNGTTTTFQIPHTRTVTHHRDGRTTSIGVNEASTASATWTTLKEWVSPQRVLFTLTIGVVYVGGKVYYKIHEELPFMYFNTHEEIEAYLQKLDGNA